MGNENPIFIPITAMFIKQSKQVRKPVFYLNFHLIKSMSHAIISTTKVLMEVPRVEPMFSIPALPKMNVSETRVSLLNTMSAFVTRNKSSSYFLFLRVID